MSTSTEPTPVQTVRLRRSLDCTDCWHEVGENPYKYWAKLAPPPAPASKAKPVKNWLSKWRKP